MKIVKPIEKIVLTEEEVKTLEKAYDIVMDIKDKSETIAKDCAETVMYALSDLFAEGDDEGLEYTIGYEKIVNKKVIFVTIEI